MGHPGGPRELPWQPHEPLPRAPGGPRGSPRGPPEAPAKDLDSTHARPHPPFPAAARKDQTKHPPQDQTKFPGAPQGGEGWPFHPSSLAWAPPGRPQGGLRGPSIASGGCVGWKNMGSGAAGRGQLQLVNMRFGRLGAVLACLGASWGPLGRLSWAVVWPLVPLFGPSWGLLGALLGRLRVSRSRRIGVYGYPSLGISMCSDTQVLGCRGLRMPRVSTPRESRPRGSRPWGPALRGLRTRGSRPWGHAPRGSTT